MHKGTTLDMASYTLKSKTSKKNDGGERKEKWRRLGRKGRTEKDWEKSLQVWNWEGEF